MSASWLHYRRLRGGLKDSTKVCGIRTACRSGPRLERRGAHRRESLRLSLLVALEAVR